MPVLRALLIVGLAGAALLMMPAAGRAADGGELARFADAVAISWVPHQDAAGRFVDPILGRTSSYGTTMIGYGLLRAGVRQRDHSLVAAGIRAFDSGAQMNTRVRSYFNVLPFAKGYAFAKAQLRDDPLWQRSRPGWERYLRSFSRGPLEGLAGPCIVSPSCFHNHEAVRTAAEIALLKTGLISGDPRSPLHDPRRLERRLLREVNVTVPRFVGAGGSLRGPRRFSAIGLLSDSGSWPLAYHGLSTAMYALSLQALPARKTRPGRAALRRAARASLSLMAPDGDVTWLGRRQQEAWALASEIAVGVTAARVLPVGAGERRSLRTMAQIGFGRLASRHPITANGLSNTPRPVIDAPPDFARGVQTDPINFNGLTILLLDLAADRAGSYSPSSIPMNHDARLTVPDQSGFTAVRHGATWYALRRLPPRTDPRYDFGLLSLKVLTMDGWHDLVEPRPVTTRGGSSGARTSVGPVIVRAGHRFRPFGLRFLPRGGGATTILTDFRSAGAKSFRLPVTYRPIGDGLNIGLTTARSGDRVEITSFHPASELRLFDDGVGDDEARISVTGLAGIERRSGFVSCCEPALIAATLLATPDASRRVSYRIAPVAPPSQLTTAKP
jgi:hypothetical protein